MKLVLRLTLLTAMLLGLPLCGVWSTGSDIGPYLEFPPRTQYVEHAPFSWPVFIGLAMLILATMLPFLIRIGRSNLTRSRISATGPAENYVAEIRNLGFPRWGWLGLVLAIAFWIVAWTRLEWMEPFQLYTLFYQCFFHGGMTGSLNIVDAPILEITRFTIGPTIEFESTGSDDLNLGIQTSSNLTNAVWSPVAIQSNNFANGTNTTQIALPTDDSAFFQIQQGFF
ncbi:MAG: hypothetical protein V3V05_05595 [Pontiella sp.]